MQKKLGFLLIAFTSLIVTSCGCSVRRHSSNPIQSNDPTSIPTPISSDTSEPVSSNNPDPVISSNPIDSQSSSNPGSSSSNSSENTHVHSFSSTWSSDDTYHWHACLGCSEISDKAEHVLGTSGIDAHTGVISATCLVCYRNVILPPRACVIAWKNYDGTVLETDNVNTGDMPSYDGATPSKPSDSEYDYVFSGWTPEITIVIESTTYTAKFNAVPISEQHEHNFVKNPDTLEYVCSCGEKNGRDYEMNITIPEIHVGDLYKPRDYTFSFKNDDGALVLGYVVFIVDGESTINPSKGTDYHFPETIVDKYITAIVYVGVHNDANVKYLDDGNRIGNLDVYINSQLATQSVPHTNITNPAWYPESEPSVIGGNFCAFRVSNLSKVLPSSTQPQTYTVIWRNYDGTDLKTDTDVSDPRHATYSGTEPTRPSDGQYAYYFKEWVLTSISTDGTTFIYFATFEQSIFKFVYYNSSSYELYSLINKNYAGAIEVPATFMGLPVVQIDDDAFKDAKNVTSLIIPDSINNIGSHICAGMTSLQSLTVPFVGPNLEPSNPQDALFGYFFGNTATTGLVETRQYYNGLAYLTSYIPSALKTVTVSGGKIAYGGFSYCANIITVNLPNVTEIGQEAFLDCASLTSINFGDNSLTKINDKAFHSSGIVNLTIPNSVTYIGSRICQNCQSLTSFTAMNANKKLASVGWWLFDGCKSLQSVAVPVYGYFGTLFSQDSYAGSYEVSIGDGTEIYYYPASLKTVKATGGIIDTGVFEGLEITTLEITESVDSILPASLAGLATIVNLSIPWVGCTPDATEINSNTQFGAVFGTTKWSNTDCYSAQAFTNISGGANSIIYYLPKTLKNVTVTGDYPVFRAGFDHCEQIESITFTQGLDYVPQYFFRYCEAAKTINIGHNVTDIDNLAFQHCESLLEAPLYEGLVHLGHAAFGYCKALTSVTVPSTVTEMSRSGEGGGHQFDGCTALTSATLLCSITDTYMFHQCTSLTSISLNSSITIYKQNIFEETAFTTFTFPEGTTEIGSYCIQKTTSLTTVNLPVSLRKIGGSAFSGCTALARINYAGTTEQWASVTKNTNWAKNVATTFVTCSNGTAYI